MKWIKLGNQSDWWSMNRWFPSNTSGLQMLKQLFPTLKMGLKINLTRSRNTKLNVYTNLYMFLYFSSFICALLDCFTSPCVDYLNDTIPIRFGGTAQNIWNLWWGGHMYTHFCFKRSKAKKVENHCAKCSLYVSLIYVHTLHPPAPHLWPCTSYCTTST